MKISQVDVILIKSLDLSKQYGARRLLSELPNKAWNLEASTVFFKENLQDGSRNQAAV